MCVCGCVGDCAAGVTNCVRIFHVHENVSRCAGGGVGVGVRCQKRAGLEGMHSKQFSSASLIKC